LIESTLGRRHDRESRRGNSLTRGSEFIDPS
jgi:hypothetical protein